MTAYDCYASAKNLSTMMRAEGHNDAATALEDAIAAGFTSGEILMALRWHLDKFLDAEPDCSDRLKDSAQDLRNRIEALLSQSGT